MNPTPAARVIAFIGSGKIGQQALELCRDHLVEIVCDDETGRRLGLVDWLNPQHATPGALAELKPTHGISAGYRHILKREVIDLFPSGIANVHTSLLPYGRGAHPNAWAIANDEPAGVTIHLIDQGVDTGPIIAQREVEKLGHDTAGTLYDRLTDAALQLMQETIPRFIAGPVITWPQPERMPNGQEWWTNRKADLEDVAIDGGGMGWICEAIDAMRARTFPGYPGALYTDMDGKRYRVRIEIEPA